jgi:hypothetical protein
VNHAIVFAEKAAAHLTLATEAVSGDRDSTQAMLESARNLWLAWLALEDAERAGADADGIFRARWGVVAFFSGTWAPRVYTALPQMSARERRDWASGLAAWIAGVAAWQRRLVASGTVTGSAADDVTRMSATLESTLLAVEAAACVTS